eukprot:TCONS_00004305-protein
MPRKTTIACCSLSQWALDFEGNLRRILESIRLAKEIGARYRVGPELEISGYGCNDHFLESDTFLHSWESLACILENSVCENILVDVGMPVLRNQVTYNCRVIIYNKKILLVRPKMRLARDGNYREHRWFTAWTKKMELEDIRLPPLINKITGQSKAPFGDALLVTVDSVIGYETCQELFEIHTSHSDLALSGAEIVFNSSGSHHELRKLSQRIKLISDGLNKTGGVYVYSNLKGCDGERVYYDGASMIFINSELVGQSNQFSLDEVEMISAVVDLDDIYAARNGVSFGSEVESQKKRYPKVATDIILCHHDGLTMPTSRVIPATIHRPEEEIALGPACWLWDYLRRSGCNGFFLPLSGGVDSSATACIVASMCRLVCQSVKRGNAQTLSDTRKMVNDQTYVPKDPNELCGRIFVTCYMGTENSSVDTQARARNLASDIGSYHLGIFIDTAIKALIGIFTTVTGKTPKFRFYGGTNTENLALQNIQARTRMVLSYLFAQLTLWSRGSPGSLLVLGSANVDESLLGYMTKYDCSSADLNPIGGISKNDLKKFIFYCVEKYNFTSLIGILGAPPTAELEPLKDGQLQQTDEQDMGLTYDELSLFGRLRKVDRCGPYSMFTKLLNLWHSVCPNDIADKVKTFFKKYAINRHKMTTVTPSYHAEAYSPDDNRFDMRPFLYRTSWPWQFRSIDRAVATANKSIITQSSRKTPDLTCNERDDASSVGSDTTSASMVYRLSSFSSSSLQRDHPDTGFDSDLPKKRIKVEVDE